MRRRRGRLPDRMETGGDSSVRRAFPAASGGQSRAHPGRGAGKQPTPRKPRCLEESLRPARTAIAKNPDFVAFVASAKGSARTIYGDTLAKASAELETKIERDRFRREVHLDMAIGGDAAAPVPMARGARGA